MRGIFSIDGLREAVCGRMVAAALFVLAATALQACGRATTLGGDDDDGDGLVSHPSQVSVAYLRSLAVGESTVIDRPLSVEGCVTANDAFGEYFKSICIEDATGGIVVLIDGYALYRRFALYDRVRVECHGLALARYGSTIQLGTPPAGSYASDYIPQADTGRYIEICDSPEEAFVPIVAGIGGLLPEYTGRTVRVDGLHAAGESAGACWCDIDPLTNDYADTMRQVADDSGGVLAVSVRGGCRYAGERIPDGRFSLCGILEYRAGAYALRITNHGIISE